MSEKKVVISDLERNPRLVTSLIVQRLKNLKPDYAYECFDGWKSHRGISVIHYEKIEEIIREFEDKE